MTGAPRDARSTYGACAPLRVEGYRLEVTPRRVTIEAVGMRRASTTAGHARAARARGRAGDAAIPAVVIEDAPRFALARPDARLRAPLPVARVHQALHRRDGAAQAQRAATGTSPTTRPGGSRSGSTRSSRRWAPGASRRARRAGRHRSAPPASRGRYGGFYTQDAGPRDRRLRRARGITVVPEIEMPGHATRGDRGLPELGVTGEPPREVSADWGVYPHSTTAATSRPSRSSRTCSTR